ncbi:PorP/SprF family type IX secretion system membrane protein [Paracrocinitomix mangrovi]|uniref:PorP/SprF family type IX secretion system membrane protein n=1 Tax=Paracrocinitomix mangrovi TaxID=2862509 RepID=UPI001C8EAC28|nr:PorP/SprF family type IX secretion system membrane protein [Paracrocinitomix mangrovi]UKN03323.1 PorP/SprF family type IX secretion system membrane protein [Paracrocinitomix mangrovi]
MRLRKLLVILSLFSGNQLIAQDIHFSQFNMNPVYLNPALTGNHECDWRFSANQRSQWKAVSRPYNTIAISAENRSGWILPNLYHGINLFHDAAGDGNFRTIEFNISTAYEIYLGKDSIHSITPGIQLGVNHRNINFDLLSWDNQYNGYYYDAALPSLENFGVNKRTGFNANVGAIYKYKPENRKEIVAGVAWFNIPQAKQSFYGDDLIKRDMRYVFHAKGTWPLNYEWDIQPAVLAQFQGKYNEIIVGANARYIIIDKKGEYIAPYGGVWMRNRDAAYLTAGIYYNKWTAGISYDLNFSKLVPASNLRGGIEFSLQYVLCIFKPKDAQYRVCPDYL